MERPLALNRVERYLSRDFPWMAGFAAQRVDKVYSVTTVSQSRGGSDY